MSFARFMELALYCPDTGYYEREEDTVGRRGDYYTSVSVGPVFGQLLAYQLSRWLTAELEAGAGGPVRLVEGGAHRGELARDCLGWLEAHRPDLLLNLHYVLVEPSRRRRGWQERALAPYRNRVTWVAGVEELGPAAACGAIISNELLDAFPVHRLGWDAVEQRWFEWGVSEADGVLSWIRLPALTPEGRLGLTEVMFAEAPEFLAVLPEGFTLEVCPAATRWWRAAARTLRSGHLLTVDYGLTAEDRLAPERTRGTLRAYSRHRVSSSVLVSPGEQDLTAHVDFTALEAAGLAEGLRTEALVTQERFLSRIAAQVWAAPEEFGAWTGDMTRQFQTLVHPGQLGSAFRVLHQRRVRSG